MKNYDLIFQLNDNEKIAIKLVEPIQEIHCCYEAQIIFIDRSGSQYLINEDSVRESMYSLSGLLNKALKNQLKINALLSLRDIGYFFNEYRQSKPDTIYEIDDSGQEGDWIGSKYLLWGKEVTAWIYNNDQGEIIFEITPDFPGQPTYRFNDEPLSLEEQENYKKYEEWIKNYKPLLIRVISREIAQQWLDQANEILTAIEDNIKRLKAEGNF